MTLLKEKREVVVRKEKRQQTTTMYAFLSDFAFLSVV